jgi:ketosteroid isomerase-like protein
MIHPSVATRVARFALAAALLALAAPMVAMPVAPAVAEDANLQAEGEKAVQAWVDAVVSGDVDRIRAILAPEFQILRADGTAYDKASYLKSNLPRFPNVPRMSDLVVTGHGDILVARYVLSTGGVRGEQGERPKAPRLTVFRKEGDTWLVVSHANFAAIDR